jgi:hypothetical protein
MTQELLESIESLMAQLDVEIQTLQNQIEPLQATLREKRRDRDALRSAAEVFGRARDVGSAGVITVHAREPASPVNGVGLAQWLLNPNDALPDALWLPNGEQRPLRKQVDVLVNVALYLDSLGLLKAVDCPIRTSPRSRVEYLVNTEPRHSNGNSFRSPLRLKSGLWLEKHGGGMEVIDKAFTLIQGFDPENAAGYRLGT